MPTKVLIMLKRKPGMSFEAFRDHYETSHARLGEKYLGPLLATYRRNYCQGGMNFEIPPEPGETAYDCITELVLKEGATLEDMQAATADPEVKKLLQEDEARFLDRGACRLTVVEVVESA